MSSSVLVDLPTRRATVIAARKLAPMLRGRDLIILDGPLGSGKTFFVRALCRALALPHAERVTSPTFTLVHEYPTEPAMAHADLYRLNSSGDVLALGLDAMREDGKLTVVEWGRPYLAELGGDALLLEFALDPRRLAISATGPRSREILATWVNAAAV
ncbi:MAG TPA: tRNA (adenosine(37)-N6)-threonylcarbamoyltransferase complex ATPase subunit type 1 TsaE [Polyangiaceae bacterium]|nr:tRNA (adenosine(37)-N6)-threonylcarbamoyltransferase complex ATPase subunit type 1 TsaE [Polyangiaceae bacterium]